MKGRIGIFLIIVLILLFGSGCSIGQNKDTVEEIQPVPVNVDDVKMKNISKTERFVGTLSASEDSYLISKSTGKVKEVYVSVGDNVKTGQPLLKIDDTDLQYSLKQAEAAYQSALYNLNQAQESKDSAILRAEIQLEQAKEAFNTAKENLDKSIQLYNDDKMTREQIQQVEAAYMQAEDNLKLSQDALDKARSDSSIKALEAQVEQAKIRMEQTRTAVEETTITAPRAGQVAAINVKKGDIASPQSPVIQLVNQNAFVIKLAVNQLSLNLFSEGKEVKVTVPAVNETVSGRIGSIATAANKQTLTFPIEVEIENQNNDLKAGMIAEVFLSITDTKKYMTIPTQAVLGTGDSTYVFIVKDNKAVKKPIKVKDMTTEYTAIQSGLSQNDLVITKGQHALIDGELVEVIKEEGKK